MMDNPYFFWMVQTVLSKVEGLVLLMMPRFTHFKSVVANVQPKILDIKK